VLITDSYRELNKKLHSSNPKYGTSGKHKRHVASVNWLISTRETVDVLDYGCGKRTLEAALGIGIANYDPAIEGFDAPPQPHDIVACTDVLEHIEPWCLADVLADIRRCTKKVAYLAVATRPASKTLEDGRNAHLIQKDFEWWKERIEAAGFKIVDTHQMIDIGEFAVFCE
jgi:hypothetical protein